MAKHASSGLATTSTTMTSSAVGGHGVRGGGRREELIAAHGFDTKYAMHCSRLGFQCIELLETGRLNLPIEGEPADWLRAVRHGKVAFDEWWERSLELDAQLEGMQADDTLRPGPDRDRIANWMIDVHQRVWARPVGHEHGEGIGT